MAHDIMIYVDWGYAMNSTPLTKKSFRVERALMHHNRNKFSTQEQNQDFDFKESKSTRAVPEYVFGW